MKEVFLHIEDMPKSCADCYFKAPLNVCIITGTDIVNPLVAARCSDCPLKCIEDPLEKPTTIKSVPGMTLYKAKVIFERNISANGSCYLTIYGEHANGYFCCIPNWKVGCEMAEPNDTFYNFEKLTAAGIDEKSAKVIVSEIKKTVEALSMWGAAWKD